MPSETDDRRIELFTMRLSKEERSKLETIAQKKGGHASDVIRMAVNDMCRQKKIPLVFREEGK